MIVIIGCIQILRGAAKNGSGRVQALRMGRGKDLKDKTYFFDEKRATGRVGPGEKDRGHRKRAEG